MDIFFRKSSIEDDSASIVKLLCLGNEHQRVKKYICEHFDLPDLPIEELEKVITRVVRSEQIKSAETIDGKIKNIDNLWNSEKQKINRILCNVFECRHSELLLTAFISVNCVCPYDFKKKQIYINYRKSYQEMLETCVHELIHYYWFDKWYTLFQDKYEEPVVWTFSEIAIDTLFYETELECYCVSEHPAHKHFYDMTYRGQNMMGYFRRLYRDNSISEFMRLGIEIVRDLNVLYY